MIITQILIGSSMSIRMYEENSLPLPRSVRKGSKTVPGLESSMMFGSGTSMGQKSNPPKYVFASIFWFYLSIL